MIDFEKAAENAFSHSFPQAQIKGCFFHFAQSLWRNIQSIGLASHYSIDYEVYWWLQKFKVSILIVIIRFSIY